MAGWHGDASTLQGFVNQAPWDEQVVLEPYRRRRAQAFADPAGVIVIDDAGFAKKGGTPLESHADTPARWA